jgi:hypothetical protein
MLETLPLAQPLFSGLGEANNTFDAPTHEPVAVDLL